VINHKVKHNSICKA